MYSLEEPSLRRKYKLKFVWIWSQWRLLRDEYNLRFELWIKSQWQLRVMDAELKEIRSLAAERQRRIRELEGAVANVDRVGKGELAANGKGSGCLAFLVLAISACLAANSLLWRA